MRPDATLARMNRHFIQVALQLGRCLRRLVLTFSRVSSGPLCLVRLPPTICQRHSYPPPLIQLYFCIKSLQKSSRFSLPMQYSLALCNCFAILLIFASCILKITQNPTISRVMNIQTLAIVLES